MANPKELHDLHSDLPVDPERIRVAEDMLSSYCKEIKEKQNLTIGHVSKLVPPPQEKEKYVLHRRTRKQNIKT